MCHQTHAKRNLLNCSHCKLASDARFGYNRKRLHASPAAHRGPTTSVYGRLAVREAHARGGAGQHRRRVLAW
jgi:hypothetical protein